jgi:hypothetical protein
MNSTLDLSPWLLRPPRQLSNEELSVLISLLAKNIRRSGIPSMHGLKADISGYPRLAQEFETWEKELAKKIADKTFYSNKSDLARNYIGNDCIEKQCGCKVAFAFYNGAGSFDSLARASHYRNDLAYIILAQAALFSLYDKKSWLIELNNSLYKLAQGVLNTDGQILILPLHTMVDEQEYFYGMFIAIFEKSTILNETEKARLGHFVYHLSKTIGNDKAYSFSAINSGYLQHIEKELIDAPLDEPRKIFRVRQPAAPSIDLWCGEDHKGRSYNAFDKMILDNVAWCQRSLNTKGRNDLIPLISNILGDIFKAEECFFVKRNRNAEFEVVGKNPAAKTEKYENAVALSALIGAPYQMTDDDNVIIAIPHYACGKLFIGASVICVSRSIPPLISIAWRQLLCFCHHVFNALYSPIADVPAEHYIDDACPWHTYVDSLDLSIFKDNIVFPPSLSRISEDISKFGKKELEQISGWLLDCLRQRNFPWSTGMTCIEELKYYEEEDTALEIHQTTTTTIMDLCERACRDDWQKTMRSVFGEVPKFFTGEEIHLMWLATHQGDGRFKICHSIKGELDEEGAMICEMLAQLAALRDCHFFMSSDDPNAYAKLLRSKVGEFSFIVMPIYGEDEITVKPGGWSKNSGGLIGVFTLVTKTGRSEPTDAEWSRWGMFVPRLCLVMRKAKEAKKLMYCDSSSDLGESALIKRMGLADL